MSNDDDFKRPSCDDDDDFDDCDSGAGSDDFDLLELGDAGEEFCQFGDQTCSIPYELYELPGLHDILSLDVWNEVLSEEERFTLTRYLPDMAHEMFLWTLKELFTGSNLLFGNPLVKLYELLKGGLCEPRVALYRQGLNFFQKHQYYHLLRKHQNSMVSSLCQMRDTWTSCKGYSIEEKLQVLSIMKSQKSLMNEKIEELRTESSDRESGDILWGKRIKDWKIEQRIGRHGTNSSMDSRSKKIRLESTTQLTAKGLHSRRNKRAGYNHGATIQMQDQFMNNEEFEELFPVSIKRHENFSPVGSIYKAGSTNIHKHDDMFRERFTESFASISWQNDMPAYGRKKPVNQLSDIEVLTANPSSVKIPHEFGRKVKHIDQFQLDAKDQMLFGEGNHLNMSMKGYQMDPTGINDPSSIGRVREDSFTAELPDEYDQWYMKRKQGRTGRKPSIINDRLFPIEYQARPLHDKFRASSEHIGERGVDRIGVSSSRNDETESDSSEQIEENGDINPSTRSKWAYGSPISEKKAGFNYRKAKFPKKGEQSNNHGYDGRSNNSMKINDHNMHLGTRKLGKSGMRVESKGEKHDVRFLNSPSSGNFEDNSLFGSGRLSGDIIHDYSDPRSNSMLYSLEGEYDLHPGSSVRDSRVGTRMGKKDQVVESLFDSRFERYDAQLTGCNSAKKRKVKSDVIYIDEQDDNEHDSSDKLLQQLNTDISKRRGKRKLEIGNEILEKEISEPPVTEMGVGVVELDSKPPKKPFILITPTVHTGFSFSIIHLLSAVRIAMTTLLPEDSLDALSHHDKIDGKTVENDGKDVNTKGTSEVGALADYNSSKPAPSAPDNVPSLTLQEIVNRVRSNPGDPCILETQEPLQDLVRGVLKIISSKTAPLGSKGWKPLVLYERTCKSWAWSGPVNQNPTDESVEEVTSPEAWGLPYKILVKLVDAFANWLKHSQETLKQIGSLPTPPASLLQYTLDDKERFKDLKAQKSLSTISPNSEEVRSYFRKEEVLRYSIPDRAFTYIATDGKKTIVAPLRRCGGKPTSKARDHFMLKRDRPPHVTILCLVRDAAARLPGSVGTRADVSTLIRDSQYIVEDVSDAQVNQVVSGALDRLHYERDPCVQFDGDRKLWVYLHRDREEEDFEDDGTASTKKWKRPRKEDTDPEQGVTVANPDSREQTQLELSSDPNVETQHMDEDNIYHDDGKDHIYIEPEHINEDKEADIVSYDDGKKDLQEENIENSHTSLNISTPVVEDVPASNHTHESRLLCQENSTNDDFDDEPSRTDLQ
ncbi:chromatin/chromatin-binding, or -regulatory protein [Lithospermum erythrorhizon]|uniref:Chromatin/chromatin-binding, or -regulatory protein n=1 Tax=Lithospermum erythrorhizon TaxID=34254 RepID=A0AAV3PD98_LITER